MDSTSEKLAEAVLKNYPKSVPTIRLSIPPDHPKRREFWELSCALAHAQEYEGGIVVQKPVLESNPGEIVLRCLRALVPNLDQFLELLAAKKPELRNPTVAELFKLGAIVLPLLVEEGVVPKGSVLIPPAVPGLRKEF